MPIKRCDSERSHWSHARKDWRLERTAADRLSETGRENLPCPLVVPETMVVASEGADAISLKISSSSFANYIKALI